jgi:hypothetical protein
MTTAGIVNCSPYGMTCTGCNKLVIAPALSEYLGSREIRHFWSCENCGHKIEMTVDLRIRAKTRPGLARSRSLHKHLLGLLGAFSGFGFCSRLSSLNWCRGTSISEKRRRLVGQGPEIC